ncbi:MAG: hypothetical protein MJZ03_00635 [archaeon]|nr:hypothetical protein [archaeon]
MDQLEVGTRVRVRKDLIPDTVYKGTTFVESMEKYLGYEATIEHVIPYSNEIRYELDIDNRCFWWTSEMFDLVEIGENKEPSTENELMDFLS